MDLEFGLEQIMVIYSISNDTKILSSTLLTLHSHKVTIKEHKMSEFEKLNKNSETHESELFRIGILWMKIFIKLPSEDGFDGSGIWSIVSTELSKKIGSDVTHFKLGEHETNVYLKLGKLVLQ